MVKSLVLKGARFIRAMTLTSMLAYMNHGSLAPHIYSLLLKVINGLGLKMWLLCEPSVLKLENKVGVYVHVRLSCN